jgi:hypothetical protein
VFVRDTVDEVPVKPLDCITWFCANWLTVTATSCVATPSDAVIPTDVSVEVALLFKYEPLSPKSITDVLRDDSVTVKEERSDCCDFILVIDVLIGVTVDFFSAAFSCSIKLEVSELEEPFASIPSELIVPAILYPLLVANAI